MTEIHDSYLSTHGKQNGQTWHKFYAKSLSNFEVIHSFMIKLTDKISDKSPERMNQRKIEFNVFLIPS